MCTWVWYVSPNLMLEEALFSLLHSGSGRDQADRTGSPQLICPPWPSRRHPLRCGEQKPTV